MYKVVRISKAQWNNFAKETKVRVVPLTRPPEHPLAERYAMDV